MESLRLSGSDSATDESAMLAAGVGRGDSMCGGVCTGLALGVTSGVGMGLPLAFIGCEENTHEGYGKSIVGDAAPE